MRLLRILTGAADQIIDFCDREVEFPTCFYHYRKGGHDLICSASDGAILQELYDGFLQACEDANLTPNPTKLVAPTGEIVVFNCELRHGFAQATPERIAKYFEEPGRQLPQRSFDAYCAKVSEANTAT